MVDQLGNVTTIKASTMRLLISHTISEPHMKWGGKKLVPRPRLGSRVTGENPDTKRTKPIG